MDPSPPGLAAALARSRALVEAARLISAGGDDLDSVLDALAEHAQRLLRADAVALNLALPDGGFAVRRPSPLAAAGTPFTVVGARVELGGRAAEAVRSARAVVSTDYRNDARARAEFRRQFPTVASGMVVPLLTGEALQGLLYVDWLTPYDPTPDDLETAESLAAHAAVAIRQARLLEDARSARAAAEDAHRALEAVFDAATDSVMVWSADGQLVRANAPARQALALFADAGPPDAQTYVERIDVRHPDGRRLDRPFFEPALRGEPCAEELVVHHPTRGLRRVHVVATPLRGADGEIAGAVVAARDVTEFHDAVAERARLDGAVKTARTVAHRINGQLATIAGYAELLTHEVPGPAAETARIITQAAMRAAADVVLLQRITRFEETPTPMGPALDLDAAAQGTPG